MHDHVEAKGRIHAQLLHARQRNRLFKVRLTSTQRSLTITQDPANPSRDGRCFLWKLPRETRDDIFKYVFSGNTVTVWIDHWHVLFNRWSLTGRRTWRPLNHLIVSEAYYLEALEAYARHTSFLFRDSVFLQRFTQLARKDLLQHIQRIEVVCAIPDTSTLLDLALACPHLRSLKVTISGSRLLTTPRGVFDWNRCYYGQRNVKDIALLQPLLTMRKLRSLNIDNGPCDHCGQRGKVCSWQYFAKQMAEYVQTETERTSRRALDDEMAALTRARSVLLGPMPPTCTTSPTNRGTDVGFGPSVQAKTQIKVNAQTTEDRKEQWTRRVVRRYEASPRPKRSVPGSKAWAAVAHED